MKVYRFADETLRGAIEATQKLLDNDEDTCRALGYHYRPSTIQRITITLNPQTRDWDIDIIHEEKTRGS